MHTTEEEVVKKLYELLGEALKHKLHVTSTTMSMTYFMGISRTVELRSETTDLKCTIEWTELAKERFNQS